MGICKTFKAFLKEKFAQLIQILFCHKGQIRTMQKSYGSDWIRIHNTGPKCRVTEASYLQRTSYMIISCSVADPDPGSGIRCLFDPWIRDPE
jgi:hypothetical protein